MTLSYDTLSHSTQAAAQPRHEHACKGVHNASIVVTVSPIESKIGKNIVIVYAAVV